MSQNETTLPISDYELMCRISKELLALSIDRVKEHRRPTWWIVILASHLSALVATLRSAPDREHTPPEFSELERLVELCLGGTALAMGQAEAGEEK